MEKIASLYRMMTDDHICPYGIKSKDLLEAQGYEVQDHKLESREEIDSFKEKHNVETTPQTFIDGSRIGGYEDLVKYFGVSTLKQEGETYTPVVSIFAVALLIAGSFLVKMGGTLLSFNLVVLFVAVAMCLLAMQKIRDLFSFSNQFITYDLLAMQNIRYAYIYPFAELIAGLGMITMIAPIFTGFISVLIGGIGAVSVIKAVYIDKRNLKCACVGGDSNVPLGVVSLTENLMMFFMGMWMFF